MTVEFDTRLHFGGGVMRVLFDTDFCHNCLGGDPFPHSHSKYELHYILQGHCQAEVKGKMFSCGEGHLIIVPPHMLHRLISEDTQTITVSITYAVEETVDRGILFGVTPEEPLVLEDTFNAWQCLMEIRQEMAQRRPAYAEKVQGLLMQFFAGIARVRNEEEMAENEIMDEYRAERIEAYLTAHRFDPDCSCTALAKQMNLSERQIHRLCLRYYNASFRQLLTNMRMDIAAHRLRTTDVAVNVLAHEIGYASAASFCAAYKRHFGYSPTAERNIENRA